MLIVVSAVLLMVIVLLAGSWIVRARRRQRIVLQEQSQRMLSELVLATLPSELRAYLEESNPVPGTPRKGLATQVQRAAYVSLVAPPASDKLGSEQIAVGLAVLEQRINDLDNTIARLHDETVTQDRIVWTVLGVIAATVGVLAGIAGLVAALTPGTG